MKPSYWTQPSVTERRTEIRVEGKTLEKVEAAVLSEQAESGWDQPTRIPVRVRNLSAGGMELEVMTAFPFKVDSGVGIEMRFPEETEWVAVPAIVRHIHFLEGGCLVGMQFRWNDVRDANLEYRICDHVLRLERRAR